MTDSAAQVMDEAEQLAADAEGDVMIVKVRPGRAGPSSSTLRVGYHSPTACARAHRPGRPNTGRGLRKAP